MDRIWAPWRAEYVQNLHQATGCFLCEAARSSDDRASLVIARRRSVFMILNRYPFANGHLMVCPYAHVPDLEGLSEGDMAEMMVTTRELCALLGKVLRAQGFNVGFNIGRAGGAGLADHLHLHVVPRWTGDTNFLVVLNDTRVISNSLEAQWELLHERLGVGSS